jgi:NADH-quinone oxidoreductase subunit N
VTPIDLTAPGGLMVALLPELVLVAGALIVLLAAAWNHATPEDSRSAGWMSLVVVLLSAIALGWLWLEGARPAGLPAMIALDEFRFASLAVVLGATAISILLSLGYMEREGLIAPEYYPLVLMAASGMMFLAGAEDLMVLFLGLEVMSVPIYVLAGYDRRSIFSAEAALKYFLIGAFASAFLLYGIALIYGATGTTNLTLIGVQLGTGGVPFIGALGLGLLLIGMLFKVSAVPFHMWAPDAYDGAPTPVTGFMATGVKAAAFLALARVLVEAFPASAALWQPVIGVLAVATMLVGNLVALAQRSLKRMLAYSSVAHAGYLLVAVWPGTRLGSASVLLYLLAYGLTTLAAFGILSVLGRDGEREVGLDEIAGLGRTRPWLALGLTICMLSLLGFPGTLGFIGKWYIISAVVGTGHMVLPVVLVLASVVSAGYYLPVIMAVYMRPAPAGTVHGELLPRPAAVTLAVVVAALLVFGVWPSGAVGAAIDSAATLLEAGATAVIR